jgi:hypothetical protein
MDSETAHFECPAAECTFVVQTHDRDQLVAMVRTHVCDRHGRAIRDEDLEFETGLV